VSLPELNPGDELGPYRLQAEIGRGGSGVVFAATAVRPTPGPDEVALKARLRDDGPGEERFAREIAALGELRVPGTVRLHASGQDGPISWFSMDKVEGVDLRRRINAAPGVAARCELVARLGTTLLRTLAGVHRRGLVHRDLKPGNVLVDGADRVWLLDFGVTRAWRAPRDPLTRPGTVVGTLAYMAPEQVASVDSGPAIDLFAAALLLYEMVTGPREAARIPQEWLARQCLERLPPLCTLSTEVPWRLSALLERMMSFDPEDRPSATQAADALAEIVAAPHGPAAWPEPPELIGRDALVKSIASQPDGPRVVALLGPAGCGRRRIAEQVRRRLLLRGGRSVRLTARPEDPGGVLRDAIAALLGQGAVLPSDGALRSTLVAMWPDLDIEAAPPATPPDLNEVIRATATTLSAAAHAKSVVLDVGHAEDLDILTAHAFEAIARHRESRVRVLLRADERWLGKPWHRLMRKVPAAQLVVHRPADLALGQALGLARSLGVAEAMVGAGSPQRAAEASWDALAHARGEVRATLPWAAQPLALLDSPVCSEVISALGLSAHAMVQSGLLAGDDVRGWQLADRGVVCTALAAMADRSAAASRMAEALAAAPTPDAELVARMALLRGRDSDAFLTVTAAAVAATRGGRNPAARRWLMVADTLPRPTDASVWQAGRFERAWCRAAASLRTERGPPRADLVAQALRRATEPDERLRARLLQGELAWRRRELDDARGLMSDVAGDSLSRSPALAAEARAARAELELEAGFLASASQATERATLLLAGRGERGLVRKLNRIRARSSLLMGDLGMLHDRPVLDAEGALIAAQTAVLLGDSSRARQSLDRAWATLEASREQGHSRVEANLLLARIEARAGRPGVAERLLARARPGPDAPTWLHAEETTAHLALALTQGNLQDGDRLAARPPHPVHPAWALLASEWWLLRDAPARADKVAAAFGAGATGAWGRAIADLLSSRAALAAGDTKTARLDAEAALDTASKGGFSRLTTEARMTIAAAQPETDAAWGYLAARAAGSADTNLLMTARWLDAVRRSHRGDVTGAASSWADLAARATARNQTLLAHYSKGRQDAALRETEAELLTTQRGPE
jgi:hypothetical protein